MGNIWADYDSIDLCRERFELADERIREIAEEQNAPSSGGVCYDRDSLPGRDTRTEPAPVLPEAFSGYFGKTAAFLSFMCDVKKKLETGYYDAGGADASRWQEDNRKMYEDLLPENYSHSFANPSYACRQLGPDFGPLLCFLYAQQRGLPAYIFDGKIEETVSHLELFIQIYGMFTQAAGEKKEEPDEESVLPMETESDEGSIRRMDESYENLTERRGEAGISGGRTQKAEKAERAEKAPKAQKAERAEGKSGLPDPGQVRDTLYWFESDNADIFLRNRIRGQIDPSCDDPVCLLMSLDTADISSLYRSGEYITQNEIRTFRYLSSLPQEEIQRMADVFTEGYREGFELGRKPLYKKRTVSLIYHAGFERMMQAAVCNFRKMGLRPTISRAGVSAVTGTDRGDGYSGASPNPQFDYDHREDAALFLDRRFAERKIGIADAVYSEFLEQAHRYGGPAVLEVFGEEPFEPEAKKEAWKYTPRQQELSVRMKNEISRITNEAIYGQERSFTIMSFPLPSIDEKHYEEIFRETMKVNTLDGDLFRKVQQILIDALDKGTEVHVLGRGKNRTNMTVQLWRLRDPEKETIFENCGADVNIPVGEVFTTPVLKGTGGVLFVSSVYLNGLNFRDLELHFHDGCVTEYTCRNFDAEEENRKYIEENILCHHKTLPIGEFAIGTNTTAYAMIKKYGIGAKMDILIAEKTGPHFAVGDTCYSWEEDSETFNPDGKKIVAKDNDFSRKRSEDLSKAYFNCHTDITIPYEELGLIETVNPSTGYRKEIIRDGYFVLEGTEILNGPLRREKGESCGLRKQGN